MWQVKPFAELTATEYFECLKLRVNTFVVDQNRVYQEVDDNDLKAVHIFNQVDDQVVAYARVFQTDAQTVTFGRVVTDDAHRGTGMGNDLMHQIMTVVQQDFPDLTISIEAQVQVQGYYRKFGFETEGDTFIFNSTPHIKMVHSAL
ncbi:GNAT family N-acetyltransferase [Secundilactobacillus paracollinoides]|uniref:GNAT family N-acetyltransferase n=1 Tax=Secundilactobacillus paracollinoides TaxID=240427 RepID=UPI0006D18D9B|nr:GNAT family N-acetyltransferase [Secundilactobacillus paracollinoides]